jgi:hypothetical protein
MNNKFNVSIALAAGLLGGLVTRFAPSAAFAQNPAPATKEIRAQSFTLVDASNRPVGTFTSEMDGSPAPTPPTGIAPTPTPPPSGRGTTGRPRIVLRDSAGREIWSAGDTAQIRPALVR